MKNSVPLVFQAVPKTAAIFFVWSDEAFHYVCTQAMVDLPGQTRKGQDFHGELQRSLTNKWAIFWPVPTKTTASAGSGFSLATRLLGGDGDAFTHGAWIIMNMMALRGVSLLDWGGEPFDFFQVVYMYLTGKGNPTCVSLNTPETVIEQLCNYSGKPSHLISWLSVDNVEKEHPTFTRAYFLKAAEETKWWKALVENTVTNLRALPNDFDPDTQNNPMLYWPKE